MFEYVPNASVKSFLYIWHLLLFPHKFILKSYLNTSWMHLSGRKVERIHATDPKITGYLELLQGINEVNGRHSAVTSIETYCTVIDTVEELFLFHVITLSRQTMCEYLLFK